MEKHVDTGGFEFRKQLGSRPVHLAILNRLGNMRCGNCLCAGKIGNGTRDFEHTVVCAGGETHALDGLLQNVFTAIIGLTERFDFFGAEFGIGFRLALQLRLKSGLGPRADGFARFAIACFDEVILRHSGHFNLNIDTIQQWPGNFAAVTRDLIGRTTTLVEKMTQIAAGT